MLAAPLVDPCYAMPPRTASPHSFLSICDDGMADESQGQYCQVRYGIRIQGDRDKDDGEDYKFCC
jgi:hypothetical protein